MRRQTFGRPGRRGAALAASAAVLCLGAVLAGCGDGAGGGDGYTAVGAAAAGPGKSPSGAVAPSGKVTLIPLDGAGDGGGSGAGEPSGASPSPGSSAGTSARDGDTEASGGVGTQTARPGASGSPAQTSGASRGPAATSGTPPRGSGPSDGSTGSTGPTAPASPSAPGAPAGPAGPAVIVVGAPVRAAAGERWCEEVTVEFRNTGGSPALSGTVTFATHIIGGLGIDWATRESTAPLPVPISAGAARKKTYTVCVDAWRVPLGMRIETRDLTAVWK